MNDSYVNYTLSQKNICDLPERPRELEEIVWKQLHSLFKVIKLFITYSENLSSEAMTICLVDYPYISYLWILSL